MKDLERKEMEWLYSATKLSESGKCLFRIFQKSAIATDGIRLHVINHEELPDKIGEISKDEVLGKTIGLEGVKAEFSINPRFLLDALRLFRGRVKIELVGDEEFWGIRISDGTERQAFIACIKKED